MNDFFGKEIKVGDTVELRADGADEGSTFHSDIVSLDFMGRLTIRTTTQTPNGVERWAVPLKYFEMSNDIVKVESK